MSRRWNFMAEERSLSLPAPLEDHQGYPSRQLDRLFVTTMAVAIAMIAFLIGIGIGSAAGFETDLAPSTELVD